jgi:hypothetical protein
MNLGSTNPANIDTSVSNVFVEAWFYAFSYPSNVAFILYKGGNNVNNEDFGLWVSGVYGVNWRLWNTAGSGFAGVTGSNNLNTNQWYHVAGSWDVTTKTIYTFLNGTLLGPGTLTGTPRYSSSSRVQIGAANSAGFLGDYYPFNGYIQDVRVIQGGIVPTTSFTPVGVPFRLNVPRYVSGGSTVLSLYEQYFTPSWLALPGTNNNYMLLPPTHPVNYDPSTSNVFVEAWVYWNGANWTATNGGAIYEKENVGSTVQDFGLYVDGSVAKLTAYMYTQNGNILRPIYGTALNVKQWYHVAFGYNTVNQTAYVWVNGLVGTTSTASNPARYSVTYTFIGNNPFNIPSTYAWNGYIQDLRVTRGGTIPTGNFTPGSAPFGLASPSYVSGGTTVLSLATQYYQTGINTSSSLVALNSTTVTSLGQDFPGAVGRMVTDYPKIINGLKTFGMTSQGPNNAWTTRDNAPILYTRLSSSIDWVATMDVQIPNIQYNVAGFTAYADTDGSVIPMHACWLYWPGNIVMFEATGYGTTVGTGSGTNSSIALSNSTYGSSWVTVRLVKSGTAYTAYYHEDNTQTFSQMPGTYTWTSQPANIRIGLLLKSGASAVYTSYYRNLSVLYTGTTAPVYAPIGFTSRAILPAVLTNPGTLQLTIGQVVTISQTAPQPANGITWTFGPVGTGLNLTSTTDYGMTLTTASGVTSTLFTVRATNRAGLTTVIQFVAGSSLYSMTYPFTFTNMSATGANGPTSITYGSSNPGFGTGNAMVLGTGTSAGMQRWTVPDSGPYTFTIAGAGVQHLNNTSSSPYNVNYISYGAVGTSTIALTAGHVLRILVGQQGTRGQSGVFARCGGCGGSFVYNETTSTLLLAAGGGGGHGGDPGGATLGAGTTGDPYRNGTGKGDDGQLGTSGTIGRAGNGGTAGINGAGGGGNTQGYGGDGGAGFNGNGNVNTANGNSVTPAKAFINGGNGAIGGNSPGGFGGGGSGGNNGGAGAGGGGGYSGGGGGANQGNGEGGGGGGSYTVGTFTSSSATNLGMGYVIVTR